MTGPVRVLLVDDHRLVRAGLASLIDADPDLEVSGQAANGAEAVAAVEVDPPHVVLMDLSMPVMDGVRATSTIAQSHPEVAIVVLTAFADSERVRDALRAGAVGYVLKDSDPETVLSAVHAAAAGDVPLDPRVAGALLPRGGPPGSQGSQGSRGDHRHGGVPVAGSTGTRGVDEVAERLSRREREVLHLVSQGMANKQIARRLDITERTVKAHMGSVFRRIGVADRTSAALWAREHLP